MNSPSPPDTYHGWCGKMDWDGAFCADHSGISRRLVKMHAWQSSGPGLRIQTQISSRWCLGRRRRSFQATVSGNTVQSQTNCPGMPRQALTCPSSLHSEKSLSSPMEVHGENFRGESWPSSPSLTWHPVGSTGKCQGRFVRRLST